MCHYVTKYDKIWLGVTITLKICQICVISNAWEGSKVIGCHLQIQNNE